MVVAENATEQIVLFSLNSIGKGGKTLVAKEVVFRAVDAQGRMAYTTARKVKSPKGYAGGTGKEEENAACRRVFSLLLPLRTVS